MILDLGQINLLKKSDFFIISPRMPNRILFKLTMVDFVEFDQIESFLKVKHQINLNTSYFT